MDEIQVPGSHEDGGDEVMAGGQYQEDIFGVNIGGQQHPDGEIIGFNGNGMPGMVRLFARDFETGRGVGNFKSYQPYFQDVNFGRLDLEQTVPIPVESDHGQVNSKEDGASAWRGSVTTNPRRSDQRSQVDETPGQDLFYCEKYSETKLSIIYVGNRLKHNTCLNRNSLPNPDIRRQWPNLNRVYPLHFRAGNEMQLLHFFCGEDVP